MISPQKIVIQYSATDDLPRRDNDGWVTSFQKALQLRLNQLSHQPPQVCNEVEESGETEKDPVDVTLSIYSPNRPPSHDAMIHSRRVFRVFKSFIDHQIHKTALESFCGYLFYRLDVDTGAISPLEPDSSKEFSACYWSRLDDLAHDLMETLSDGESGAIPASEPMTIFVAHASEDLSEERNTVIRELKQYGHRVVPEHMPILDEAAFQGEVESLMARSNLSVHLVGRRYGEPPQGSKRSMMELELLLASQQCRVNALNSLIWIRPDLVLEDMRQRRFLDQAWDASAHGCADIYQGSLVEFMEILFRRLQDEAGVQRNENLAQGPDLLVVGHPFHGDDCRSVAEVLGELDSELQVALSFGEDEDSLQFHQASLVSSEAVLFLLPQGAESWLDVHLLELRKAVGYGRQRPFRAIGVCYGGSGDPPPFRFLGLDLLRVAGSPSCSKEGLQGFLRYMKEGEPFPICPAESFNPFPGLRSFQSDEKHLFFAREEEVRSLIKILRLNRFLALVGPSGSGKSSLVRSGLIPALRAGHLGRVGALWRTATMSPGDHPVDSLAAALIEAETGEPPSSQALALAGAVLRRGSRGLADFVAESSMKEGENLLILVDQFEELFRFDQEARLDRDEALAFTRLLLSAPQQNTPIYIIVAMRSDFLEDCAEFPGLVEAINRNTFLVPRMNREQRGLAITGPVAVGGGKISKRLVNQLVNDMGSHFDPLPVVQHALMRAWNYWETHHGREEPMDMEHYRAVGAMEEALSRHAEEAYRDLDEGRMRFCAEKVFETLTFMGSGGRGMRRPSRVDEIAEIGGIDIEEVIQVVECFRAPGRSFLLPPASEPLKPQSVVDITHESLMRVWNRLADWGDAEVRAARIYKRLVVSSRRYHEGLSGLWRDPELQTALRWKEEFKPTPAWGARHDPTYERAMLFLETSRQARDDAIVRKEKAQRRQLKMRRNIAIAMGLLALLAIAFFLIAHFRGVKARSHERRNTNSGNPAFGLYHKGQPNPNHSPTLPT